VTNETVQQSAAGITATVNKRRNQYANLIKDAGNMSQQELSDRICVHRNTISKWATGKVAVPGPVRAYLRLFAEIRMALVH